MANQLTVFIAINGSL